MTPPDPFNLQRFLDAQEPVFRTALAELRSGAKRTHWMWFVFPQLRGLGRSSTARFFGIVSLAEARAYLDHPVLGSRLALCTEAVLAVPDPSLGRIFGAPDDIKFVSSMTLFDAASDGSGPYRLALERFCGGLGDEVTLGLLAGDGGAT